MDILEEIITYTKERMQLKEKQIPLRKIREIAESKIDSSLDGLPYMLPFARALKKQNLSFICEIKKASPSKGIISKDFDYLRIAKEYEKAGASALSCLTEPKYFLGSDEYFKEILAQTRLPMLRKDFIISPYMIYEAKALGAAAILLIAKALDDVKLRDFSALCDELNMDALFETHDEKEIERALKADAKIIGVNNRNLQTFQVDLNLSVRLRKLVPREIIFVAESGISSISDLEILAKNNVNAVLIGEWFMKEGAKVIEKIVGKNQ